MPGVIGGAGLSLRGFPPGLSMRDSDHDNDDGGAHGAAAAAAALGLMEVRMERHSYRRHRADER